MLVIYTDGSAKGNGKENCQGGFGVIVCEVWGDENPEQYVVLNAHQEFTQGTTNNREELKAILWTIKNYGWHIRENPIVYSDSQYCVNSFNDWIWKWKKNGWKRPKNKPVENLDLMLEYDELMSQGYGIDLRYIKGHNGEKWNEVADSLATGAITTEQVLKMYGA